VTARDERLERACEVVGRDLADERAAAGAGLYDPKQLEGAERLADRRARDLELIGERALRRELVPGVQLALLQERLDLLDDALVEPAAPDWLDGRQIRLPVVWSGGLTSSEKTLKRSGFGVKTGLGRRGPVDARPSAAPRAGRP
jgi:hypothetical protein